MKPFNFVVLMLFSCIAAALPGDPPNPSVLKEIRDAKVAEERNPKFQCERLSKVAATIMESRQSGASMSSLMSANDETSVGKLFDSIVILAYESPRYLTTGMQKQSVEEFENSAYLKCIKAYRN